MSNTVTITASAPGGIEVAITVHPSQRGFAKHAARFAVQAAELALRSSYRTSAMCSIVEITADNAAELGVGPDDAGRVALISADSTVVVADLTAARYELAARRGQSEAPEIGEALPVGSGRQWLAVG